MKKILALTFILMIVSSCYSFDSRKNYLIEKTEEYVNDPVKFRDWLIKDTLLLNRYYKDDGTLKFSFEWLGLEPESNVTYDFKLEDTYCDDVDAKRYNKVVTLVFINSQNYYYVIAFEKRETGLWKHQRSRIYNPETEKFYLDI